MEFKVYNKGDFEGAYNFLRDYLKTKKDILLTPPGQMAMGGKQDHMGKLVGLSSTSLFRMSKGRLEDLAIKVEEKGFFFKRTKISIKDPVPEDIKPYLISGIIHYAKLKNCKIDLIDK